VSDIDTAVVDSLKALDPEWPIREADIHITRPNVRFWGDCVAKLPLMRIANHDSVGRDGIGGSGA
jgi:hypothetical protein